jgi:two-component system, sensor histidine kinase
MPPAESARAGLRVLVVEDDPNGRKVLMHALDVLKPELTMAVDGQQAVEAFARQPFDVVLMDLQLPVMDGYAATREIRAIEQRSGRARTPVVVVSAHTRPWEIEAAQGAGADHHLGKPLSVPALLGTIDALTTPL